ncbi:MAG: preprotein translocase subunit SecE [Rickettsiales bacterium]|jgi:preprotein translocase SecE subunit|nr:preprotein translocase subunit SecE [Rickettsiales bacterium]
MLLVGNIKRYLKEVIEEYKKVIFPKWKEVRGVSIYIGVVVFLSACLIWVADFIISYIIKIIFGLS